MPRYNGTCSNSKLDEYAECAHRFQLLYIERKTGVGDVRPAAMGSLVHDFCDAYVGQCVATGLASSVSLADSLAKSIFNGREAGGLEESDREEFTTLVMRFARSRRFEYPGDVHVEVEFAIDRNHKPISPDQPKAHFRGRLDLLHLHGDVADLVDYTTSWSADPDKRHQLMRYAYLVHCHNPNVTRFNLYVDSVRWNRITGPETFDVHEIAAYRERLESEIQRLLEDRVFQATPGSACYTCPVAHVCRAEPGDIAQIRNADEAVQRIRQIARDEARLKIEKKSLRAWVSKNGPVTVDGDRWGVFPVEKRSFDLTTRLPEARNACPGCGHELDGVSPTMFAEACRLFGIEPEEVLAVNGTKMRKHLEDPVKRAIFMRLATVSKQGRFGRQKEGDEDE